MTDKTSVESLGTADNELINHLCRHSSLTSNEAAKVIAEVLNYYEENLSDYVKRRHLDLQAMGVSNSAAFEQIQQEIPHRRFQSQSPSIRQIRRIIYG
ncbi:MAG: hypothetical protein KTR35_02065 [Gammaproteobacteria bacterium]|nr:hypothetical protein [Gammaproteobacteria bacterium]